MDGDDPIGLLSLAAGLTRLDLLGASAAAVPTAHEIAWRVHRVHGFDLQDCHDAVKRVNAASLDSWEAVPAALSRLHHAACVPFRGQPRLRVNPTAWHLHRAIDPELLLVGCAFDHSRDDWSWPSVTSVARAELGGVFDRESVDTHVHLAGILTAASYWCLLVGGAIPFRYVHELWSDEPGFASGRVWADAIAYAAWDRLEVARAIAQVEPRNDPWPLLRWPPEFASADVVASRAHTTMPRVVPTPLQIAGQLAALLRSATGRSAAGRDLECVDPLRVGWSGSDGQHEFAAERRFVALAIRHAKGLEHAASQTGPSPLERFVRYLRVRNAFHQMASHQPGGGGLRRFVGTFDRRLFIFGKAQSGDGRRRRHARAVKALERYRARSSVRSQLVEAFLDDPQQLGDPPTRRVELRVSMPRGRLTMATFRAWLEGAADVVRGCGIAGARPPRIQVGFVVHAVRRRGVRATEADLREHGGFLAAEDMRLLERALTDYPELRRYVVGFDVAGAERVASPRLYAEAMAALGRCREHCLPHADDPPIDLGVTWHVGEDPHDLLTGLRNVDEAITLMLDGRDGEFAPMVRIGHGLALAVEPSHYYRARRVVPLPLGLHLLDLAWAWGLARGLGKVKHCAELERRYAACVPTSDPALARLAALAAQRRDHRALATEKEVLFEAKLDDALERPANLAPDPGWEKLVGACQKWMRRRVADLGVCVEANPTSNRLILGLDAYHQLPTWTLTDDGVRVSINTDDPGMFLASLPGEFAHMLAACRARGMTHAEARAWITARAEDARETTFLSSRTPYVSPDAGRLRGLTRRLLP